MYKIPLIFTIIMLNNANSCRNFKNFIENNIKIKNINIKNA